MNRRVDLGFPCPSVVAGARALLDARPALGDAASLRARANRYRILLACLCDDRVIAAVEACAAELEAEADLLEILEN
jgi:hypothetical protein